MVELHSFIAEYLTFSFNLKLLFLLLFSWHFVTIEINLPTKSLDVKVDHFGWMSIEMKSVDLNFHYKDTVLTFGGASKDECIPCC